MARRPPLHRLPAGWRPRVRRRRLSRSPVQVATAALVAAVLLVVATGAPAHAAYLSTTANPGNSLVADTLNPPTGLSASRPCAVPAPVFRNATTATTNGTSLTINKPAGVVSGDVMIAMLSSTDGSDPPSLLSGWTELQRPSDTSSSATAMFAKVAGGSEPGSYSFSGFDSSDSGVGMIVAYSGAAPATPWEVSASGSYGSNTTLSAPTVTTATASTRLVSGYVAQGYSGSFSTPAGTTARGTIALGNKVAVFDKAVAATGATGAVTSTVSPGVESQNFSVALRANPANKDGTVTLSWTITTDTYATGYDLARTGAAPTTFSIAGRTTASYVDSTLAATVAAGYSLTTEFDAWVSTAATTSVAVC